MHVRISVGIAVLVMGYVLSQFYRAFMAVLSPVLNAELGASPGDLALSSGLWFLVFAACQIPVGWSLDRFGPARTVALPLALGAGLGAAVFALATAPWHLHVAMALIGAGCAPVLMGSYYIFARSYPPAAFGALTGMVVGIGSLGNIVAASPLVWLAGAIGWRASVWALAAVTLAVAAATLLAVRDPEAAPADAPKGSLGELLRIPALWCILPLLFVNYAASAGVRGLWAGPYLEGVFAAPDAVIGQATLVMGLAMVAGNFLAGPFVRLIGSPRRAALACALVAAASLCVLWLAPAASLPLSVTALGGLGLSGAGYVFLMAHGRQFLPPHLVAQGMTFLNMISIGGVGIWQFASRPVYQSVAHLPPANAFSWLYLFFLVPLVIGVTLYLWSKEGQDG